MQTSILQVGLGIASVSHNISGSAGCGFAMACALWKFGYLRTFQVDIMSCNYSPAFRRCPGIQPHRCSTTPGAVRLQTVMQLKKNPEGLEDDIQCVDDAGSERLTCKAGMWQEPRAPVSAVTRPGAKCPAASTVCCIANLLVGFGRQDDPRHRARPRACPPWMSRVGLIVSIALWCTPFNHCRAARAGSL